MKKPDPVMIDSMTWSCEPCFAFSVIHSLGTGHWPWRHHAGVQWSLQHVPELHELL